MNEQKKRSILKSVSYRIICIISQTIVTYAFTHDILQVGAIVLVFQSVQTLLYYLHERAWNKVRWGAEKA
jgi:uncharacterized membrane protein